MAGELINDYGIGDTNFDSIMLTLDAQRIGFHSVSLTEYDTTTVPAIAAGSKMEINGALAKFDSEEAITGSPSDGDAYIYVAQQSGTAAGATTDSAGYSIGATVITLASAGTGTIIVGDRVTFTGDTVKYEVTSGDADVSNGGSITLAAPGLLTAIATSPVAITAYAGSVIAVFTNTAPTWSDSKQGWYGTGGNANYRYCNFIMTKATAAYSDKRYYLHYPKIRIDTIEPQVISINDMVFNDSTIAAEGHIDLGAIVIQWGVHSSTIAGGAFKTITLSKELDNAVWAVTMASNNAQMNPIYNFNTFTTTSFRVNNQGGSTLTFAFTWIAIGK